ncbi:MAG: PSD1 domain-containing protein [Verrucomicrobia bacterium]|nr:PSD1 domain-containing protein [Verrucomicrobiota bacterium]
MPLDPFTRARPAWRASSRLLMGFAALALALPSVSTRSAGAADAAAPSKRDPALTFEQHVRPILKAHCFDCHGEGDRLRGGLDLRLRRLMVQGGESGPALVPGQAEASLVFKMVSSGKMPKRDRKLSAAEIETLSRWIREGAGTAREEPRTLGEGMQITAEERSHWAFQPLRRPSVPKLPDPSPRNPIDSFLAARQAAKGVSFSPDASSRALVRRAFLDLWGLPPTPSDVDAFTLEASPETYAKLVDRLMDSPHYGERWGRLWLDVAGYADSDGYSSDDTPRPFAYKFRDYVIRSMNQDLPFDRFVLEQLAGDELALAKHPDVEAASRDPVTREWLAATGFLRMAADGTSSGGVDAEKARNQVMADTLKIVSTSLLGLSVGCAQCHDHRYDPVPQTDYYRLRAIFEPAYDWKRWRNPSERLISLYTAADRAKATAAEAEAAKLGKDKEAKQSEYLDAALKKHLEKMEPALRDGLWTAFKTAPDARTPEQKKLLADHPSANINAGVLYQYDPKAADDLKAMDARIAEARARKPVEDFLSVLTEPIGATPVTYRFHRGDPKQPKEPILPGVLSVLAPSGSSSDLPLPSEAPPTSRRRLAFGKWATSPANPLLARVIVNRVWMHHFGRGLVGTPADFGLQGERPSHPELLDWLASVFSAPACDGPERLGLGWSLKRLHRLIMTSTAYRQSSSREPGRDALDPENRLYWRRSIQRLDAESIRDSILAVSGALNERMFGPPVPVREDVVGQVVVGVDKKQGDNKMPVDVPMGDEEFRRSLYVETRRSRPLAFLNAFDAPVMEVNCERRTSSTVAPQSLMLMNSDFLMQQSRFFADRLRREAGSFRDARVDRAWRLAFGRPASAAELQSALRFLEGQVERIASKPAPEPKPDAKGGALSETSPEDQAMRSLCQDLLSSNEFLYID